MKESTIFINDPIPCLPTGSLYSGGVHRGSLPFIGPILARSHQTPLTNSNIRLVEAGSPFEFELALQGGTLTQYYQNYLKEYLGASVFPAPQTAQQLIKVNLLLNKYSSPASLTLFRASRSEYPLDPYTNQMSSEKTLYLFLSDDEDMGIATAFWNSHGLGLRSNKLFLPREVFVSNIGCYSALVAETMPYIDALFVTTPLDRNSAFTLGKQLKNAFSAVGRNILVEVLYRNFRFNFIKGTAYWGQPVTTTQIVASDSSVRFSPPVPPGHENAECVFGYDAEVVLASGRRLFMPATRLGAILLSNQLEEIEFVEKNESLSKSLRLRNPPVRVAAKGIAGTAIAGKECRFYIHKDEVIITRQLKEAGFEVKPNKHTRYAEGVVRRLGGFEKARLCVNQGGLDIISVLRHPQAKEGGLNFQQLVEFTSQRGISKKEARNLLEQQLPSLLSSGLVRRGYSLTCSYCELTDWYSIDTVGEFIECEGCAQPFQLNLKRPNFAYKPNELAARFEKEGGPAVLMTTDLFYQLEPSAFIQFGGDLLRHGDTRKSAEVDLFWVTGTTFAIAECKSYYEIDQDEIIWIKDSLDKNVQAATQIGAQVVVLGVVTRSLELSDLFTTVIEVAQSAKDKKIGVHLALNGKLYLWGNKEVAKPWTLTSERLRVDEPSLEQEQSISIGEPPRERILVGSGELFDDDVLARWEQEVNSLRS